MQRKGDIVRYTADELNQMHGSGQDLTDWEKVDATTEQELEASIAADPDDVHDEPDWSKAIRGLPAFDDRQPVSIDTDVLTWFKAKGAGYRERINDVLRAYIESQKAVTRQD